MASVTIYDVAAYAGVSIKTVSRAMNGEPNVSEAAQERVRAAAEALGYSPSLSARSLAGARSFVIAAFVDASLTMDHWRNGRGADYLARIQLGATMQCRETGYHFLVELIDHDAPQVRGEVKALLAALKPAGVILTPPSADNAVVLDILHKSETPYVRLGPERDQGFGLRMRMQDHEAAFGMTEHLIGLGHSRIGFIIGEPRYGSSRARLNGFLAAMSAHGLATPDAMIQHGDYTFQSGLDAARAMLGEIDRPTAIFASNDDMALGCVALAAELGLSVPEHLSIAGFDDSAGSRFSRPQLTTVRQPLVEMAAQAARLLIAGEVKPACDQDAEGGLFSPFELVVRGTTAPPRW